MFELSSAPLLLAAGTTTTLIIAVLAAAVLVLAVLVGLLRRKARVQIGPLVIEPASAFLPRDNGDTTGPYPLPYLSTEETEPFDLEEIKDAMNASKTLRAIEALRAAEAKLAAENLARAKARGESSVRTVRMSVCPLCMLYEITGSSPKVHVIPSDMREVDVGRAMECQIRSTQANVSQRHFRLHIRPQGTPGHRPSHAVVVEDCDSRNGTWVNGTRVESNRKVTLGDGDIIEAASVRYLFYFVLRGDG